MARYDIVVGLLSFFCPCIQFGRNAQAVGDDCLLAGISQFVPILDIVCRFMVRGKIREQKGIEGTAINDLLCVFFCANCALAQEGLEVAAPLSQSMGRD
jgi:Cys-rich protein (TIGR01571 family)